jgi:hypothetical protein
VWINVLFTQTHILLSLSLSLSL